ncbi:hypothetical protein HPP92_008214 [Vanilla planifolia]|uniref:FHA domain-containing protein n=1 Tax=Vanilla planifolia TaxID=51239 RepID=A0A835RFA7_VANPL|nr:hypothetical protein HPP92_008214 [Vanilla planifolia]
MEKASHSRRPPSLTKRPKNMALSSGADGGGGDLEVGFAKLQGEDFEYYMQTYSIVLGRNSKRAEVDVDLASLGGGMSISRHHARIFYDFSRRRFALEVLGKNGCFVEGVLHVPGTAPVKLDSQDLLQIGEKKFYFLLPTRSVFGSCALPRRQLAISRSQPQSSRLTYHGAVRSNTLREDFDDEDDGEEEQQNEDGGEFEEQEKLNAKRMKQDARDVFRRPGSPAKKSPRWFDEQIEDKQVLSSVATMLSKTCGPGEWMSVAKLHAEMLKQHSNTWHHGSLRSYLSVEEWHEHDTEGKPWFALLMLLKKHPNHFVVNTRRSKK